MLVLGMTLFPFYCMQMTLYCLQSQKLILIDLLHEWCIDKKMNLNLDKTKIAHFRNPATPKSNVGFVFGNETIEITNQYTYLGILFSEHLDYNLMAKQVAK